MINQIKSVKGFLYTVWFTLCTYLAMTFPVFATATITKKLQEKMAALWDTYWFYIAVFVALGVLSGILAFIVLFMRLGANSNNPQERSRIFKEMTAVAICTALLGGITFIVKLYLSLFN